MKDRLLWPLYMAGFFVRDHVLFLYWFGSVRDDFWRKLALTFLLPLDFLFLLPAKAFWAGFDAARWRGVFALYNAIYEGAWVHLTDHIDAKALNSQGDGK